jgi:uncharacterized protein
MNPNDRVKLIQGLYDAFGRGDVSAILDALTDDVEWGGEASSNVAPWYGVRHGKGEVAAFFEAYGSTMDTEEFTPYVFGTNDDAVFALVRLRATSRATGRSVGMVLHHYFRFREDKVCFYRGTEDTAQVEAALRA